MVGTMTDGSLTNSCSELPGRNLYSLLRTLFVTLAVAATLCDGTVLAECGDYLFRNGKRVTTHPAQPHVMPIQGLASDAHLAELPAPSGRPCYGPNCSQAPVPAPVLPLPSRLVSEPAMLLDSLLAADLSEREFAAPVSERGAKHLPLSLFRPPQSPAC